MDPFNILQLNARSIKANKVYIESALTMYKVSCALISESWLKPTERFSISGYNLIRCDRPDGYGGSCILLKNNIPFSSINVSQLLNNDIQFCVVNIFLQNKTISIGSIYCAPGHKTSFAHWNQILHSFPNHFILGGDFNAHHQGWGSYYTNRMGENLIDAIDYNNICILNDGSPTLLSNPMQHQSAIDLTLCSPIFSYKSEWQTLNNTFGSNHLAILIKFYEVTTDKITIYPTRKWNTTNANWERYYSICWDLSVNYSPDIFCKYTIEEKYNII